MSDKINMFNLILSVHERDFLENLTLSRRIRFIKRLRLLSEHIIWMCENYISTDLSNNQELLGSLCHA